MTSMDDKKYSIDYNEPQHPLPKEIRAMDRDDTICQFCGVSYLIHNEIKRMEEKMKEMEEEMKFYQGSVDREKELKVQVKNMEKENEELTKSLNEKEERISLVLSDVKLKNELLQSQKNSYNELQEQFTKSEESRKITESKLAKLCKLLPTLTTTINEQRKALEATKSTVKKESDFVSERVQILSSNVDRITNLHGTVTKNLNTEIEKVTSEKCLLQEKLKNTEKLYEETKSDHQNLQEIKTQLANAKSSCTYLEEKLKREDESLQQITQKNKLLENDLAQYQEKVKSKSKESEDLRTQLQKRDEMSRQESMRTEQLLKRKDEDLRILQVKIDSLEKQLQETAEKETEVKRRASSSHEEVKNLRVALQKAKEEVKGYKMERDKMIAAHHNRIEQLRESFKKKMEEADAWPTKLEEKLKEQEQRLQKEKDTLWQELNDSFQQEMQALEKKHETELKQFSNDARTAQEKLKSELSELSRASGEETRNFQKQLSAEKDKARQDERVKDNLVSNMQAKIADLELRLSQRSAASADDVNELKKKFKLSQETLHDAEKAMNDMESRLKKSQEEIAFLQDTVGRECEERFELISSLSDARAQLIQLQRSTTSSLSRVTGSPGSLSVPKELSSDSLNDSAIAKKHGLVSSTNCNVTLNGVNARPAMRSQDSLRSSRDVSSVDDERDRIAAAIGRKGSKTSLTSSLSK